jgi:hypothetical protein
MELAATIPMQRSLRRCQLMSFYSDFTDANDRDERIATMLHDIEIKETGADKLHGEALLRRILLTTILLKHGHFKIVTDTPFSTNAIERVAMGAYSRVNDGDVEKRLRAFDPQNMATYANISAATLHPYSWGNMPYALAARRSTILAEFIKRVGKESEQVPLFQDMLDKVDRLRRSQVRAFKLACLYSVLDTDGALLDLCEDGEKVALAFKAWHFAPVTIETVNNTREHAAWEVYGNKDAIVYLRPTTGNSTNILCNYRRPSGQYSRTTKPIKVSAEALESAWKMPVPKVTSDTLKAELDAIAKAVGARVELSADQVVSFKAAFISMLSWVDAHPDCGLLVDRKAPTAATLVSETKIDSRVKANKGKPSDKDGESVTKAAVNG